ncbi:MAG: hypothetical protein N2Z63_07535 [Thiobacillaceae bacterium]|nr:hypothetical protein [Thiobacillaceae bacterium]MDW8323297.1 hypothetical protein [Burkholderiales bacterium]
MTPRCYAYRRVNPYRGVVHVLDLGEAYAETHDGRTWHLHAEDGQGGLRPVGVWVKGEGLRLGGRVPTPLLQALQSHPPLPFRLADRMELWLLDKQHGLPLALLASCLPSRFRTGPIAPEWHPFVLSHSGFHSSALAAREEVAGAAGTRHRDWLARMVNAAARPYPAAQWFLRRPDGSGEGRAGLRLSPAWEGRTLPAQAFPALLLREVWNNPLEQSVIDDYHNYLAPLLLMLPELSMATRARLEAAAFSRPMELERVHRLLPCVLDHAGMTAALVAARLLAAQTRPDT